MNKVIVSILVLLASSSVVQARTAYVTDSVDLPLRSSESERSKIVKMLPNGMALTLLGDNTENGYTYVRAENGAEGFILTRYLSSTPISRTQLEAVNAKLATLQEENQRLKESAGNGENAIKERDSLSTELSELKHTSTNAIQLKQERDQLQERVISAERELEHLKRENQALTDNTNQDWFVYGGSLALLGVLLGFLLPKLSWRRRTSTWDTF
ncbi:TIGR04211 family SH3 domain-containing protein [Methylomonas lenta]|uniref:TIGR04211 family SH3 domain-containing protein n=1 Tax=Methylomonas lenta TaxID=980561 RepID=UPI0008315EFD|nr:TIGR04211 family SH3 domain-containing protein [Methylomonas lenta]